MPRSDPHARSDLRRQLQQRGAQLADSNRQLEASKQATNEALADLAQKNHLLATWNVPLAEQERRALVHLERTRESNLAGPARVAACLRCSLDVGGGCG